MIWEGFSRPSVSAVWWVEPLLFRITTIIHAVYDLTTCIWFILLSWHTCETALCFLLFSIFVNTHGRSKLELGGDGAHLTPAKENYPLDDRRA